MAALGNLVLRPGDPRVTNTIANLAASASVVVLFDLGPMWEKVETVAVIVNPVVPSSGLASVSVTFRDDAVAAINAERRGVATSGASGAFSTAFSSSLTSASGPQGIYVRPLGRYMAVAATNADAVNALGATSSIVAVTFPR